MGDEPIGCNRVVNINWLTSSQGDLFVLNRIIT